MTQGLWCFCCASLFASESHATQCLTTAELSIISGEPPGGLLEVDVLGSKRNSHAVASRSSRGPWEPRHIRSTSKSRWFGCVRTFASTGSGKRRYDDRLAATADGPRCCRAVDIVMLTSRGPSDEGYSICFERDGTCADRGVGRLLEHYQYRRGGRGNQSSGLGGTWAAADDHGVSGQESGRTHR